MLASAAPRIPPSEPNERKCPRGEIGIRSAEEQQMLCSKIQNARLPKEERWHVLLHR